MQRTSIGQSTKGKASVWQAYYDRTGYVKVYYGKIGKVRIFVFCVLCTNVMHFTCTTVSERVWCCFQISFFDIVLCVFWQSIVLGWQVGSRSQYADVPQPAISGRCVLCFSGLWIQYSVCVLVASVFIVFCVLADSGLYWQFNEHYILLYLCKM